jgi:hypothetical protein
MKKITIVLVIVALLVLILVAALVEGLNLKNNLSTSVPFEFNLVANPASGTILQGHSLSTNITVTWLQGQQEKTILNASIDAGDITADFSKAIGTPSQTSNFTSTLTISSSASTKSQVYTINVTATASNGKTATKPFTLTVLCADIDVSGTVTDQSSDSIWPVQIQFINTDTNESYTAGVITTQNSRATARLIQQGSYSISLPNQQSYKVICCWDRLFGPWSTESDAPNGTFSGGTINVYCPIGVSSLGASFGG